MTTVDIDDPEAVVVQKLESERLLFGRTRYRCACKKPCRLCPEKQRMVFNLKYYQEMKYEEMSEIFGTSVGALKSILSSCGEEN